MKNIKNRKDDNGNKDTKNWYRRDFYGWDSLRTFTGNCWNILKSPHYRAVLRPHAGPEKALVEMVSGWVRYADTCLAPAQQANAQATHPQVPNAYAWSRIGLGLQDLLSGPRGRLERSSLSGLLGYMLQAEGYPSSKDYCIPDVDEDILVGLDAWEKDRVMLNTDLQSIIAHWQRCAERYRSVYEQGIAQDAVCGPAWAHIGKHLLMMLSHDSKLRLEGGPRTASSGAPCMSKGSTRTPSNAF